jgi:hypothetical protein
VRVARRGVVEDGVYAMWSSSKLFSIPRVLVDFTRPYPQALFQNHLHGAMETGVIRRRGNDEVWTCANAITSYPN